MNPFLQCFLACLLAHAMLVIGYSQITAWFARRHGALARPAPDPAFDRDRTKAELDNIRREYLANTERINQQFRDDIASRWKTGKPIRMAGWVVAPLIRSGEGDPSPDDVEYRTWENGCMSMLLGNDTDHLTRCPMCNVAFHSPDAEPSDPDDADASKDAAPGVVA